MKIAYISNSTIPSLTANSIQVMKMCQAMVQKGFEVELYVPRRRIASDLQQVDLCQHYGIQSQFKIRKIFCRGRFGYHLYSLLAVLKAFRAKVDIIYTRDILAAAIATRMKVPVICELHNMPIGFGSSFYFRQLLSSSNPNTILVVITEGLKRRLLSVYSKQINERSIIVAPDGVDIERFGDLPKAKIAREKLEIPNRFTVGYAGHLYRGRGVELILEIAASLPHVQFLLLGGEQRSVKARQREIKERCLSNVHFQGFVPNAILPIYLSACDVLVMPYQRCVAVGGGGDTADTMSPMKLFEYMATERLIISSDLQVLREVLNKDNAVLLDPENIQEWQRALERGETDVKWRLTLSRQARCDVEQYSWQKRVDKVLEGIKI